MDKTGWSFPFNINELGRVDTASGNDDIRNKVLQVLLTSPGERVNLPEFGCGLRDLVFDPNNEILAATTEFTVRKSLQRWLAEDIIVQAVDIHNDESSVMVEVAYLRRDQLQADKVKITF
ncbi:MAG TPA: GPW/gp25 family protein [Pyrinomonadaceae bacterium]|jgi:phage baseplate assembly protein W